MSSVQDLGAPAAPLPVDLGSSNGFVIVLCPTPRPAPAGPPGFFGFQRQRLWAWSNVAAINPLEGLFFGWALTGKGPLLGPLGAEALRPVISDIDTESGQYCLIKTGKGGLILSADPYGLTVIFHGTVGGYVFCSNRLHLIAEAARRIGLPLSLNRAAVLSQLCVDAYIAKASNTRWTPLDGIEYAMPGDRLHLDFERGLSVERPEPDLSPISEPDYASALRNATDRYVAQIENLVKGADTISLGLTAGYDSRLVLGGLLAAGARARIRVWTQPIEVVDTVGSGLICESLGLRQRDFSVTPPDAEPAALRLARNRSMTFLINNKFRDFELAQKYFPAGLCISGGGGESLRAVNGLRYPKGALASAPYSIDATRELLMGLGRSAQFEPSDFEALLDVFHREFLASPGQTLIEKMEWNDFQHGNRFHFAPQDPQMSRDKLLVCGAVSSGFRRLALRMPFAQRADKRLFHDVLARLHPALLEIPFTAALQKDLTAHPDRFALPAENRPAWYVALKAETEAELGAYMGQLADDALNRLCQSSEFAEILTKFAVPKLAWYRKKGGHGFQMIWWSRLLGLQDVLGYCDG